MEHQLYSEAFLSLSLHLISCSGEQFPPPACPLNKGQEAP